MKIAVTIPKYNLGGGAEFYCAELTGRLSTECSYDFHVLANKWRNNSERIAFHKVPVPAFPRFLTTPGFAYYARKEIINYPFDLVHAHDRVFEADIFTMHGIPHRIWAREVRRKKQLTLFDRATVWTERRMVRTGGCRKFLAVSSLTRDLFMREYPEIEPSKIEIVHPGITLEDFQHADRSRSRADLEQEFGISPDELAILFVSMNFDIKGLDFVMRGLSRLRHLRPDKKWKLLVIGKGETRRYTKRAIEMGIQDRMIFAGVFQRKRLNTIYSGCDIFAMPSKFDTFGMTVLEAMAASLPVIISGNVGAKDLVTPGENGFVLDRPDDQDAFAQTLEILMDENARIRMGKAARQTALRHGWNAVAEKMERIYGEVHEQKKRYQGDSGSE